MAVFFCTAGTSDTLFHCSIQRWWAALAAVWLNVIDAARRYNAVI